MQKSIRKPQNWQDSETLCKKLWTEEFASKNFKKNKKTGQKQDGVDVYGMPNGKANWNSVQAQNRSRQANHEGNCPRNRYAEKFYPPLEHLIIASTTLKDVEVEKYLYEFRMLRGESRANLE